MSKGDDKIDSGYRVYGPNTADGKLGLWCFPSLETANHFAQSLCEVTQKDVMVMKFCGRWRPVLKPVEYIQAEEV